MAQSSGAAVLGRYQSHGDDYLHLLSSGGAVVGGVDNTGEPFGNMMFPVKVSRLVLTPSQITQLNSSPVQMLPAPGSSLWYNVVDVAVAYQAKTTPYTITSGSKLFLMLGQFVTFPLSSIRIDVANSSFDAGSVLSFGSSTLFSDVTNKPLSVAFQNSNPTNGDGNVIISVYYTMESFA